jgi:hypothetical protein
MSGLRVLLNRSEHCIDNHFEYMPYESLHYTPSSYVSWSAYSYLGLDEIHYNMRDYREKPSWYVVLGE